MPGKSFATARNTMRPMRPKPLIPTLIAICQSPELRNFHPRRTRRSAKLFLGGPSRPSRKRFLLYLQNAFDRSHDGLGRDAEVLEQRRCRGGFAEAVDA